MKRIVCIFLFLLGCSALAEGDSAGPKVALPKNSHEMDKGEATLLERHYPVYFAYSGHLSKVQLSFKTPLVRNVPVFFGYTQVMFWDLGADSKPFRDLTYNPEIFYRWNLGDKGFLRAIDFIPWSHNSNGKQGQESRSYEKVTVRAHTEYELKRNILRISAQASYLYGFDPTNRDIQDYIGPFSIAISFIQLYSFWIDKGDFTIQASPGGKFANKFSRGGYQFSYSFRLGGINLVPAFYLQYYTGYAETLLNYNKHINEFRGGFIF